MEVEAAALVYYMSTINYYMLLCNWRKQRKLKRRCWMIKMHLRRTRAAMEETFSNLMAPTSVELHHFMGMSASDFEILLNKVGPSITKQDTRFRMAIPAKVRLALTLRFLATGDNFTSMHFMFKMSHQIISKIIKEVCSALVVTLNKMIRIPANEHEWLQQESKFKNIFPHCIGAIDGRHVVAHSDKKTLKTRHKSSIVLLAVVDRDFCFMFCDIETRDRISDGEVFKNNILYEKLSTNDVNLPQPAPLPGDTVHLPYVFVADNAFELHENVMNPYPGEHAEGSVMRKFNNKLASVHIVVENAFGVMCARFRVLRKTIHVLPEIAATVVMSCALLHNFLRRSSSSSNIYTPPGYLDSIDNENVLIPGTWRLEEVDENVSALRPLKAMARSSNLSAMEIRNHFAKYFSSIN